MSDTLFDRVPRDELPDDLRETWDFLNGRTGEPTFVEVFAQAPELLKLVMHDFYEKIFYGGRVEMKYKELARLKLALSNGCNTCILQNEPGCKEAGYTQEQINAVGGDWRNGPFDDAELAVLRELDTAGVRVSDFQLRRPTLDDVFLTLTATGGNR